MKARLLPFLLCGLPLAAATPPGALTRIGPNGEPAGPCPLKHTAVTAAISGSLARVTVVQEFENPYQERIEAVYTFPLPASAAVDDMTMLIGDRTVAGKIKRREEARAMYEAARRSGQAASLLEQERPNIFTQSVANIRPGEKVKITIRYVETVKYEDGNYEFGFPMVVGPRYIPRGTDGSRITPPVTPKGTRAGHDISIAVTLDAGVPINFLRSLTHDIDIKRPSPRQAELVLKNKTEIPNKDFVLQYDVSGAKIADAVLAHRASKGGFFSLILQPPDSVSANEITPKEIVFVLDTSGSMMGFPIEKAKEAMKLAIDGLNVRDTFNLITFAGDTRILFPQPVPATPDNVRRAQQFLASRQGSGGTEMMKAIRVALDGSGSQEHIRIVCFMTDGFVGNDMEIISEIQKHPNARVFSFGIGSSVNRFLLDKMAEHGRGEVEYVTLQDDGSAAAKRFHERVRSPLLTDLSIEWSGLPVSEVYPKRIPDLFSAKPVVLSGRYASASRGAIRVRGKQAGRPFVREIAVALPESESKHDVLATLWARRKVDDLMGQDWAGMQRNAPRAEIRDAITQLGLDYRLMTQFTAFVAVEEKIVTEGGVPRRVEAPVEMPEGVSYEGVFGDGDKIAVPMYRAQRSAVAGGIHGGIVGGVTAAAPPPPPAQTTSPPPMPKLEAAPVATRKLDPDLAALTGKPGKVDVKVWLSDASAEALGQLKEAGLEITLSPPASKFVQGRIDHAKLEALARLTFVRYVGKP